MVEQSSGGSGRKPRSSFSGSQMSRKQLARTAIDGRKLTFTFADGAVLDGYLCGMDDFHWMIVTSNVEQVLVHKGSAARITIGTERGYDAEPERERMDPLVEPFRKTLADENLIAPHLVNLNASERIS